MKLSPFTKSFLGGAAGAALLLTVASFIPSMHNESSDKILDVTINDDASSTPVQAYHASYVPENTTNFRNAAQKSLDAVVHIKTEIRTVTSSYHDFFGPFKDYFYNHPQRENTYSAFGSGVIITSDGYIVTNNHVVNGADRLWVKFNDGHESEATIIGQDPSTDLALIKVERDNLPYLTYGDSDALQVGDWVLAVGNPFNLNSTVTAGIVSAKARNINILGSRSAIESFIQTDAVVNRGNSGGALVNTDGELVGINAAIASHTGVYEGYSFAIPVNIVHKVVEDLMTYGEIQRAYIGVQIQDMTSALADELGTDRVTGVYVGGVMDNSGAQEAGIESGDVIVAIDDKPTNTLSSLMGTVAQYRPGDKVMVTILRDNKTKSVEVELKNENGNTSLVQAGESFYNDVLAAELEQADLNTISKFRLQGGLTVLNVNQGILQQGGINKGFVLYEVNGRTVNSRQTLDQALDESSNNIIRIKGMYPNGVKISYEFMR